MTFCCCPPNLYNVKCDHILHKDPNESSNEFFKKVYDQINIVESHAKEFTFEEKEQMIKSGNIDNLFNDHNPFIGYKIACEGYYLDYYVKDPIEDISAKVARQGYGLEELIHDSSSLVRKAVANHSYGLDILKDDSDPFVRAEVAKMGYNTDVFTKDESEYVRMEVAALGFDLDKLLHDKSNLVKSNIIKHGYGLDVLIKDKNSMIVCECKQWLCNHNMSIEYYIMQTKTTGSYEWVKNLK